MQASLVLKPNNPVLGEGPVWDDRLQLLYWVDIYHGLIHSYNPETQDHQRQKIGQMLGAAVPCRSGKMLLAMQHGFAFYDLKSHKLEAIGDPESNLPLNRFNDGKCDPAGRFWAGTMQIEEPRPSVGSLYRLNPNLEIQKILSDIQISNGLAWNHQANKMYYIDTLQFQIMCFDFDLATGSIRNRETLCHFDGEFPDGMCIDENDHLWVAFYGSAKLGCFDSRSGQKLAEIQVPAQCPTSCAFGGPALDTLYITSAAKKGDPHGGGLFSIKPGVRGRKPHLFADI